MLSFGTSQADIVWPDEHEHTEQRDDAHQAEKKRRTIASLGDNTSGSSRRGRGSASELSGISAEGSAIVSVGSRKVLSTKCDRYYCSLYSPSPSEVRGARMHGENAAVLLPGSPSDPMPTNIAPAIRDIDEDRIPAKTTQSVYCVVVKTLVTCQVAFLQGGAKSNGSEL